MIGKVFTGRDLNLASFSKRFPRETNSWNSIEEEKKSYLLYVNLGAEYILLDEFASYSSKPFLTG